MYAPCCTLVVLATFPFPPHDSGPQTTAGRTSGTIRDTSGRHPFRGLGGRDETRIGFVRTQALIPANPAPHRRRAGRQHVDQRQPPVLARSRVSRADSACARAAPFAFAHPAMGGLGSERSKNDLRLRNKEHFKTAVYFHCGGLQMYRATQGKV
jgi:hypothetical protein